jgi:hypothetical protein
MIVENFLELVDIHDVQDLHQYVNMIDIGVKDDESFLLSNGIISHNSASGSLKQCRDSETDAIYALKGKVKNTKKLSDLASNVEWLDITSILEIEPGSTKMPAYDKIIIAADEDCIHEDHLVITQEGNKKIQDICYTDKVLTHTGEYKSVEKIVRTEKKKYIEFEVNGEKIVCSENHTLLVFRKGQIVEILAKHLKSTDFILLKNEVSDKEQYIQVNPVNVKTVKESVIMYDITVKDDHTFFVYLNEHTKVLMHNCDGQHITSLIISFFHQWFPHIINSKKLFRLITPLVVCDVGKEQKYFYSLPEYEEFSRNNKTTNLKYLKGLGSLSVRDWEYVMNNKTLFSIIDDSNASKFLDIAFGDNANRRKTWLST